MVQGRLVWVALLGVSLLSVAVLERRVAEEQDADETPEAAEWRHFNERCASTSLKTLTVAEADFRGCDGGADRIGDFWATDVRDFYAPAPSPLPSEEVDVRAADRDWCHVNGLDFWTEEVRGYYTLNSDSGATGDSDPAVHVIELSITAFDEESGTPD